MHVDDQLQIGTQQHLKELFHVHIYYVVLFYWQILTKPLFQEPFDYV